jgi:hypothetical protein
MGLLGRFFKGSLSWEYMWKQTWKEILWYYDNYELQITEEEVIYKYQKEISEGKRKKLPKPEVIRKEVDEIIAERRRELNGEVE